MKEDILSLSFEDLENLLVTMGEKKYRAQQIFFELHNGKTLNEISTISQELKNKLLENFDDNLLEIVKTQTSTDGTKKFLYKLRDNNLIEGVLMNYKFGYTLCVSTQVGCRMGCKFCASGLDGVIRNLTSGEIISQVILVNKLLCGNVKERKITNIVLMGSGEPLDNYENVLNFFKIATNKFGLYFSERNISLSTCGILPKIKELADSGFHVNICLSLHASNDKTRQEIMPVSRAYNIKDLINACKYYFEKTNRRILIEYILIDNVNSSVENALELSKLLKNFNCIVNLINLNEVKENNFKRCNPETSQKFLNVLKQNGINATLRRSLGNDIDGACGQLRRKVLNK